MLLERENSLSILSEMLAGLRQSRGGIAIVGGEAGIGKTSSVRRRWWIAKFSGAVAKRYLLPARLVRYMIWPAGLVLWSTNCLIKQRLKTGCFLQS
jgi:hypothetical protein